VVWRWLIRGDGSTLELNGERRAQAQRVDKEGGGKCGGGARLLYGRGGDGRGGGSLRGRRGGDGSGGINAGRISSGRGNGEAGD
jgi:hypothetical protein